jgi:hypothetical protein
MPEKIVRSAHFKVCEDCGNHGHIVFSDGSEGKEVATKSDAFAQLAHARKAGKLFEIEVTVVRKQITDSTLLLSWMLPVAILSLVSSALSEPASGDPVSRRPEKDKTPRN